MAPMCESAFNFDPLSMYLGGPSVGEQMRACVEAVRLPDLSSKSRVVR